MVTGKIDTTSETPPVRLGVIAIGEKKIYLNLINKTTSNDIINEEYSGEGYSLKLSYKINDPGPSKTLEGKLIIGYGNLNTEYTIVGEPGYQ